MELWKYLTINSIGLILLCGWRDTHLKSVNELGECGALGSREKVLTCDKTKYVHIEARPMTSRNVGAHRL